MKMSTKLQERIKWIQESDYSDEWKEVQIKGAIRSAEALESRPKFTELGGTEEPYPRHNPFDLPAQKEDWRDNPKD